MKTKYIFLLLLVAIQSASAETPTRVRLKEKLDVPIVTDGKTYGAVTLPPGTALPVRSANGDTLFLDYRGSSVTVPASKTDFGDQIAAAKAEEERIRLIAENARLAEERRMQEREAKKPQEAYEQAQKSVARMKRNSSMFVGPDVDLGEQLIRDYEWFIREYESGDEKAKLAAYAVHTQTWTRVLENKPVYGYRYNEILKQETTVPITFNIYKDADSFYIKVGDGAFCTVASIPPDALLQLAKQLIKITEWSQKCVEQQLDAEKDAGSFGGVKLEFVSKNNAENIFVWLTARGAFAEDRLVEKQTVRLNMLNLKALFRRITKANELYNQREKARSNADKLK